MSDWPNLQNISRIIACSVGRKALTGDGYDTKGAYVELEASCPGPVSGLLFQFISGATGQYLTDIAIGSAGNEIVIIPDITYTCMGTRNAESLYIPVTIPQGARISGRTQKSLGSASYANTVMLHQLVGPYQQGFQKFDNYGANAATSGGIVIDPGATVNTKGNWVQITAACNEIKQLAVMLTGYDAARETAYWKIDVGIGSAGNEVVVIGDLNLSSNATTDIISLQLNGFLPLSIPAGTRIAMRAECTVNTDPARKLEAVLIGAR